MISDVIRGSLAFHFWGIAGIIEETNKRRRYLMATVSFGRPIVVTEKNVKNLIHAAEHPINVSKILKDAPPVQVATREDVLRIKEKYCK